MSMYGSLGDFEEDPFLGNHMRHMSRMMSSMSSLFNQPFGGMLAPGIGSELMPFGNRPMGGDLMPFGFPSMPNMNQMFQSIDPMGNNPHCTSYSSSSVMTMTNGPDGRPQVYQASSSVRQGPGGVKETKKAVCDSRSGVKKLAIGHHIGDRAHILEREQNVHSGDQEERQDYINLDEDEADEFNREWTNKTKQFSDRRAIAGSYPSVEMHTSGRRHRRLPALPPSTATSPEISTSPSATTSQKRQHQQSEKDDSSDSDEDQQKKVKKNKSKNV